MKPKIRGIDFAHLFILLLNELLILRKKDDLEQKTALVNSLAGSFTQCATPFIEA